MAGGSSRYAGTGLLARLATDKGSIDPNSRVLRCSRSVVRSAAQAGVSAGSSAACSSERGREEIAPAASWRGQRSGATGALPLRLFLFPGSRVQGLGYGV
jgi:hypothetical protein